QDFTTGSNALFPQADVIGINANGFDALKHHGLMVEADARAALDALGAELRDWRADTAWTTRAVEMADAWRAAV
ncbi:3D-(3,5/4)-trihydroxycyclohexane-1,2-dione acylhydrolase (decyclizing), partial [Escherichia coli]|nr:3D-(3,5/4)-trihydroxycyclohexane-1,2-dione acylhydrolase (decyclizing) [Escherichia coli]